MISLHPASADADSRVARAPLPGAAATPRIPGFRLLRHVGRGRHAQAWLAWDVAARREVVLKVQPAGDGSLMREYAIAQRLAGPRIVQVHGCGEAEGRGWLAMEYLSGGNLRRLIGQGSTAQEALALLRQAAEPVAQLHRQGLVHRDVKPDNLLLRATGELVLADFGLVTPAGALDPRAQPGAIIGTPRYVAPEQLQGAAAAPAADVYSLGVLLHEMLRGCPPFSGETLMEVLSQHLVAPLPRLAADIAGLQPLLDRMLAKEVKDRLPDADAVLGLLGQRWLP
ncbi:serine/threonine-protein kinase [Ramlibacter alkalitolerans]|uniref:Serine/threonine protein kinase n=1 Tax=Ramlibacter alkalitolerans TaxID=2039631 RepID=A0ABS1JJV0_9BURK|nr:serine/threonine-protein kinase [Ramlibacter alkalitolerans]MBL0424498.1 serine/threonine protein kinase [Ramlibacter alkalitolerans]